MSIVLVARLALTIFTPEHHVSEIHALVAVQIEETPIHCLGLDPRVQILFICIYVEIGFITFKVYKSYA